MLVLRGLNIIYIYIFYIYIYIYIIHIYLYIIHIDICYYTYIYIYWSSFLINRSSCCSLFPVFVYIPRCCFIGFSPCEKLSYIPPGKQGLVGWHGRSFQGLGLLGRHPNSHRKLRSGNSMTWYSMSHPGWLIRILLVVYHNPYMIG